MTYNISTTWSVILAALLLWELVWKGFALWKASHKNQKGWFIAILILNTAGILPIVYLLTHMEQPIRKDYFRHSTTASIKG